MSEREDLQEVLDKLGWKYKVPEQRECLSQPEQTTREPLSDDEIDLGYQESCGNYYDLAFRDGVRFAEKAHGIGVDDEK